MKKTVFLLALVISILLVASCEVETNYTEDGHYGKVIIHNEAASGKTITRIAIGTNYNERVTIAPGKSSNEYTFELSMLGRKDIWDKNITITLDDNTTKSRGIKAYEDIVVNLYFNGTDLVER
jgi:hypothetical protein